MLDDYTARVLQGVAWVIEEGSAIAGIIVLLPGPDYLLLDNIVVSPARQGSGTPAGDCWPSQSGGGCAAAIVRSASVRIRR
jgi:hypothetical protein